ncbi:hypothetical protein FVF58_23095 [Paraburkholderia panacisoli]|uniref:Uncharacterized protein n=1 Tax=Paraburkholderia panacisoli TaxID=2603818 RepID=A0A5B0GZC7_9BURK|nr:hypothetical protein [Paraburkholderia panacisoli]KAA1008224.1 hypothetical protein FVF58_23095 [Paraburkholderia panacisoli]
MSVITEAEVLRRELKALAAKPEWDLLTRYDLLGKKLPPSLQERVRHLLASAGLISPHVTQYPWLPTLKHRPVSADFKTVMIWALDADRHQLRAACEGFSKKLQGGDDLAPVLVTDIADFASYSRLGWLVEYVPSLSGEGPSLQQRKQAYLAWRYRDACILPLSAGLASEPEWNALLKLS